MSFVSAESTRSGQMTTTLPSASSRQQWTPHDYQIRGIKICITQGACGLFLDPGLGKTAIVLAAFKILKMKGFAAKLLIVAPLRVALKTWPDEIKKWADFAGLSYQVLHGKNKEANLEKDADIYIINPEGLSWLFQSSRKRPEFDVLCIDESTKFKKTNTQRFKLIKSVLNLFKRRWILTGTPVPNGMMDLFGQIYILDQGASLGRFITHYRMTYFDENPRLHTWTLKPGSFERITDLVKPLVLRLAAEDYLKMPELIYNNVYVELPPEAMKLYAQVESEYFAALESGDNIVAANAAAAGMKVRQIANGAVYHNSDNAEYACVHDAKLEALEDLIEELNGAPLLILYEFRHDLARIQKHIPGVEVIGSGQSLNKLNDVIDKFNSGRISLLAGHPASMGHGLNLQGACHHVVCFGITWDLDYYKQAIARIYRQGQKSGTVFVYHIVASGTRDEKVVNVLTGKDRTQNNLLAALTQKETKEYDTNQV